MRDIDDIVKRTSVSLDRIGLAVQSFGGQDFITPEDVKEYIQVRFTRNAGVIASADGYGTRNATIGKTVRVALLVDKPGERTTIVYDPNDDFTPSYSRHRLRACEL